MLRLSLLVTAVLSATTATTHAAIVFDPPPVPTPSCTSANLTLNPYYQAMLNSLNRPYYSSIDFSFDPCSRPTVDINSTPAYRPPPAENYFRKADLLPRTYHYRPAAPAASMNHGTIYIIPKNLLNRPLKSLTPPKST